MLLPLFLVSCNESQVGTDDIYSSKNVNIPDRHFKNKIINAGFDANGDGEISYSEAKTIDTLYVAEPDPTVWNPKIEDVTGIETFINLVYFNSYGNDISGEVDFSNNVNLVYLYLGTNEISRLKLHNLSQLKELNVLLNELDELDLSTNTNLRVLNISLNNLTHIDITNNINLEVFGFLGNSFTSIDFRNSINLRELTIAGAHHNINYLDISNCTELENLTVTYIDDIAILDISQNKKLQRLTVGFLDNLEKICVWELPFPDSIEVNSNMNPVPFEICD
jgi:hypothetical protein